MKITGNGRSSDFVTGQQTPSRIALCGVQWRSVCGHKGYLQQRDCSGLSPDSLLIAVGEPIALRCKDSEICGIWQFGGTFFGATGWGKIHNDDSGAAAFFEMPHIGVRQLS